MRDLRRPTARAVRGGLSTVVTVVTAHVAYATIAPAPSPGTTADDAIDVAPADDVCRTKLLPAHLQPLLEREAVRREAGAFAIDSFDPIDVPIRWHVVASSDGLNAVGDDVLRDALAALDEAFAPVSIRFCLVGEIDVIVNDGLFEDLPDLVELWQTNSTPNAIDVYWVPTLGGGCGQATFSFMELQGIVIAAECFGDDRVENVVVHEVGHYFDLYHLHETIWGPECEDGSNCELAGDLLCDTPASINLGFDACVDAEDCSLRSSCANWPAFCPPDATFDPLTRNVMAYVPIPCMRGFTAGQLHRARTTLELFRPELLGHVCGAVCAGDLDESGSVDANDMMQMLAAWGSDDRATDLDGSGIVDAVDLIMLLDDWGACST